MERVESPPWQRLLEELGHAVADLTEGTPNGLADVATTVRVLEDLAGIGLGETADESSVVLARRFARAHHRLLAEPDRLAGCERRLGAILDLLNADQATENRTAEALARPASGAVDLIVETAG